MTDQRYPLLSVITVCFNNRDGLKKTLNSIQRLDYPRLEVLVIDNCSTDETPALIASYGNLVNTFISESDRGPYDAMNKGVQLAQGEWICFMNSGDCFPEDTSMLRRLMQLPALEQTMVLYGDTIVTKGNLTYELQFDQQIINQVHHGIIALNHQSVWVRKELFQELGYFDVERFRIRADMHWLTRVFMAKGPKVFHHSGTFMALYNEEGLSSNPYFLHRMQEEDELILKDVGRLDMLPQLRAKYARARVRARFYQWISWSPALYHWFRKIKYSGSAQIKDIS